MFKVSGAVLTSMVVAAGACAGDYGGPLDSGAPAELTACTPPKGITGSPATIADAVALANGLLAQGSDELTLPCFVASLSRPMGVLPVDSVFSAQPGDGVRSPRIFLFSGPLVLSVTCAVSGIDSLELAEYTSPTRSIKAEIDFPLRAPLSSADPYEKVRLGPGTLCSGCHTFETPVEAVTFAHAFESDVLRPRAEDEVSISYIQDQIAICDAQVEPDRCNMLKAVFGHGQMDRREFSLDARTIYGN